MSGGETVYWTGWSGCLHLDRDCHNLRNARSIRSGSRKAREGGSRGYCRVYAPEYASTARKSKGVGEGGETRECPHCGAEPSGTLADHFLRCPDAVQHIQDLLDRRAEV